MLTKKTRKDYKVKKRIAFLSVWKKDEGILNFAKALIALGFDVWASGGTASYLLEAGVYVKDIADVIGQAIARLIAMKGLLDPRFSVGEAGELLSAGEGAGHQVVTLAREFYLALLSRRDNEEDLLTLKQLGLESIDLLYCDPYPLEEEIASEGATIDSVIKRTDIGGPTMLRAAAKAGIIAICDPNDLGWIITKLRKDGDISDYDKQQLRAKVEKRIVEYCLASAMFHSGGKYRGFIGEMIMKLAYAENYGQSPAFLFSMDSDWPLAWRRFELVPGSGIAGYVNMCGGDRARDTMSFMAETFRKNFGKVPYIAIGCKHGNTCGVGVDWNSPRKALLKALHGDTRAVMGAEVMTNFPITDQLAEILHRVPENEQEKVGRKLWGVDVIFAPSFSKKAIEILTTRKKKPRRLLANSALANPTMPQNEWIIRLTHAQDGFLIQKAPRYIFTVKDVEHWVGRKLSKSKLCDLIIAFAVTWRATSNTVGLAKDGMLIGLGAGQNERTKCCWLAIEAAKWAGHKTKGASAASDGFFFIPKRTRETDPLEGPERLVKAGCIAVIVPYDGKNREKVREYFMSKGIVVAFVHRDNRGFRQH